MAVQGARSAPGDTARPATGPAGYEEQGRWLVGCRLSHYAVVSRIGTGGMGVVYRAVDERLQRDVALKMLTAAGVAGRSARCALMAEARILSRLDHPHVAAVYDVLSDAGRDFLVMEYVAGATVDDLLRNGPLPAEDTVRLGTQMARGLAAAHEAQVIHRDVKPANLKVTPSGTLKILDFGLARLLTDPGRLDVTTDKTGGVFPRGTVPYMAPEQLRGDAVDRRSDIFSAGAVLYYMATGRTPFPHQQIACLIDAILNRDPLRPSAINPLVPPALERVILAAMQKDPRDRPQSAVALARSLDAIVQPVRTPQSAMAGGLRVSLGSRFRRRT